MTIQDLWELVVIVALAVAVAWSLSASADAADYYHGHTTYHHGAADDGPVVQQFRYGWWAWTGRTWAWQTTVDRRRVPPNTPYWYDTGDGKWRKHQDDPITRKQKMRKTLDEIDDILRRMRYRGAVRQYSSAECYS